MFDSTNNNNNEKDDDQILFDSIKSFDVNNDKKRLIDFTVYFSSEDKLRGAANAIGNIYPELEIVGRFYDESNNWMLSVATEMLPNLEVIKKIQNDLVKIAHDFGGEYDGWGSELN